MRYWKRLHDGHEAHEEHEGIYSGVVTFVTPMKRLLRQGRFRSSVQLSCERAQPSASHGLRARAARSARIRGGRRVDELRRSPIRAPDGGRAAGAEGDAVGRGVFFATALLVRPFHESRSRPKLQLAAGRYAATCGR
jgi:hypothetical protein